MWTDERTNGCTDTTKLMVTFRSFANSPNVDGRYKTIHTVNFKDGKLKNDQCCCYTFGLEPTSCSFPNNSSINMALIRYPEPAWTF